MPNMFNIRDRVQTVDGRRGILLYFTYERGQPNAAVIQVNPTIVQRADKGRRRVGEITTGGSLATIPLAELTLLPDDGKMFFEPVGLIGSE